MIMINDKNVVFCLNANARSQCETNRLMVQSRFLVGVAIDFATKGMTRSHAVESF